MLTVEQLMEELTRLPEQVRRQEIKIGNRRWSVEVEDIRWEGGHILLMGALIASDFEE